MPRPWSQKDSVEACSFWSCASLATSPPLGTGPGHTRGEGERERVAVVESGWVRVVTWVGVVESGWVRVVTWVGVVESGWVRVVQRTWDRGCDG